MRYLSTVYVRNHRARVQHRKGALVVSSPEGSQRVPLEAIDAVIVLGGAQITTQALDACVQRGVRVAALQMSGAVRFVVNGPTSGNVHLRTAQFGAAMDDARSLVLAKAIVAAKLQSSSRVVGRWARDERNPAEAQQLADRGSQIRERIERLSGADTADHVRGNEGGCGQNLFSCGGLGCGVKRAKVLWENAPTAKGSCQCAAGFLLWHARDRVHRRSGKRWLGFSDGFLPPSPLWTTVARP